MSLDFRVRVAWATDPFSVAPTWTDVSAYVEVGSASIDITRGTGDLDDAANPSTLSLTFVNKDGRFTPGYTGGAYYPNVVLGKRIQVHAFDGVTYYPRFDGFIDSLPMQWAPAGKYAEAQVTAVDRLKQLGRQLFKDSLLTTYIQSVAGLQDYWPLSDAEGTVNPVNLAGTTVLGPFNPTDPTAIITYGVDGLPYDDTTAVQMELASLKVRRTSASITGAFTLLAFFRLPDTRTGFNYNLFTFFDPTVSYYISVDVSSTTGEASFTINDPSTGAQTINSLPTSQIPMNDGEWHSVAAMYDPAITSGTMFLYIDGVGPQVFNTAIGSLGTTYTLWSIAANFNGASVNPVYVQSHSAIYSQGWDTSQFQLAGLTGLSGETSHTRANRIALLAGITATNVGTAGTQSMGPWTGVAAKSYAETLQEVQDTENGEIYFATDGTLKTVSRRQFDNAAAALTLAAGQYGSDLSFLADDSRLINDAVVTDGTGTVQEVTNSTSITASGTYSVQKTLNTTDPNEALGWAQYEVNVVSATNARVSQVTVDLLTNSSLRTSAWALDLGNRVDLTGLPTGAPSSSVKLQVAGYTESYSLTNYTMTINTNPFLQLPVWQVQDATYGVLDSTTILAY